MSRARRQVELHTIGAETGVVVETTTPPAAERGAIALMETVAAAYPSARERRGMRDR
jgi:hypothetical protein